MPPGGLELEIAVVFADIRGSTTLCETVGTTRFAELVNGFYRRATECLVSHDAIVDKLIGDEVMALFIPGIAGVDYRHKAALAAIELVKTMADEPALPVGAAVNSGIAYVGNVGTGRVVDFTALGDPVNTASRLQSQAAPGEVIMSDEIFGTVRNEYPDAPQRQVEVRGRKVPASIRVIALTAG
jgi:adenylate cyclase